MVATEEEWVEEVCITVNLVIHQTTLAINMVPTTPIRDEKRVINIILSTDIKYFKIMWMILFFNN